MGLAFQVQIIIVYKKLCLFRCIMKCAMSMLVDAALFTYDFYIGCERMVLFYDSLDGKKIKNEFS